MSLLRKFFGPLLRNLAEWWLAAILLALLWITGAIIEAVQPTAGSFIDAAWLQLRIAALAKAALNWLFVLLLLDASFRILSRHWSVESGFTWDLKNMTPFQRAAVLLGTLALLCWVVISAMGHTTVTAVVAP